MLVNYETCIVYINILSYSFPFVFALLHACNLSQTFNTLLAGSETSSPITSSFCVLFILFRPQRLLTWRCKQAYWWVWNDLSLRDYFSMIQAKKKKKSIYSRSLPLLITLLFIFTKSISTYLIDKYIMELSYLRFLWWLMLTTVIIETPHSQVIHCATFCSAWIFQPFSLIVLLMGS